MWLLLVLAITLVLLVVVTTIVVGTAGAVGILVFSDVIVCTFIIIWIMRWLVHRKKK